MRSWTGSRSRPLMQISTARLPSWRTYRRPCARLLTRGSSKRRRDLPRKGRAGAYSPRRWQA